MLLNHFGWDKEKLIERFYDGDQSRLFDEAHIVNPFNASSSGEWFNFYLRLLPIMAPCFLILIDVCSLHVYWPM